jgi:O-antigen/teichoic acid export membrane protein
VPNALRLVLLPIVAYLDLPITAVAHVLSLSLLLPWLWTLVRLTWSDVPGVTPWTPWDYQYGGKLTLSTLLSNQLQGVDIIVAGALFSSTAVADYAIAARMAALYPFFQQLLLRKFTPRAGYLLARDDMPELRHELAMCRRLSITSVGVTTCVFLLSAPVILPLFGEYHGVGPLLGWLALPAFVRAFFLGGDRVIQASGRAGVSLSIMTASFLFVVVTPFATWRWLGIASLPFGMTLSAMILNSVTAWFSWRVLQLRLVEGKDLLLLAGGCALFSAYALWATQAGVRVVIAALLVAFSLFLLAKQTNALEPVRA